MYFSLILNIWSEVNIAMKWKCFFLNPMFLRRQGQDNFLMFIHTDMEVDRK